MPDTTPTPAYDALTPKQRAWLDAYLLNGLNASAASRSVGSTDPRRHGHRMATNGNVRAAMTERLGVAGIGSEEVAYLLAEHARGTAADYISFTERLERREIVVPVAEAIARLTADVQEAEAVLREAPHSAAEREAAETSLRALRGRLVRAALLAKREPDAVFAVPGPPVLVREPHLDVDLLERAAKLHLVKSFERKPDGSVKVEFHDAQAALDKLARALGLYTDRVDVTSGGQALTWYDDHLAPADRPPRC